MANRPTPPRKADIERTLKGVMASGLSVCRIEVEGGKMVIFTGEVSADEQPLDAWRRKNGQG